MFEGINFFQIILERTRITSEESLNSQVKTGSNNYNNYKKETLRSSIYSVKGKYKV